MVSSWLLAVSAAAVMALAIGCTSAVESTGAEGAGCHFLLLERPKCAFEYADAAGSVSLHSSEESQYLSFLLRLGQPITAILRSCVTTVY